jgi:hypothetical protein
MHIYTSIFDIFYILIFEIFVIYILVLFLDSIFFTLSTGGNNQENIRHIGCFYQTRKHAPKNVYENLTVQHF